MDYPFFNQIVDSLSEALITVDRDKNIVIWNKMAETLFGYDLAGIKAAGIEAIIPPAYRQRHREGYEAFRNSIAVRNSYVSETHEFEALRKNGEIFPIELAHSMVKVDDREYFITAIIRDISLRKHYELMSERFERITRHDLKNKLVIIALASQRLSKALAPDENSQACKYTEIIREESIGLLELLDSTKELVLLETGEYKRRDETIELAPLLERKAQQFQPLAASRGVTVDFCDRTARKFSLRADRSLFERAVENLLKNAVEAEEVSGSVKMTLVQTAEGVAVLTIHNGGKPIPQDIQGHLFSPYVTHGKKDGSGLGLYSTKLILEAIHGWGISFRSDSNGTTFTVTFGSPPGQP
ncbi:MAG: PAS domain-containing sensor histidine kinase [Syntrophobacteraceae bacterium]|nr:PAS domain-containing sensor histidine kinase [Syntrophobacteraceae bacterium]